MNQDIYVVIEHLRGQVADISYIMLAAGRVLAQGAGGRVVAVLLGHNAQDLAEDLAADRVLYFDHPAFVDFNPDSYQAVLASVIEEDAPRAILLGNTTIGSDVASVLSARLGLPLVSSCLNVSSDGVLTSQICGGKIMTETRLADTSTLITMVPGGYALEQGQSQQAPEVVTGTTPTLGDQRITLKQYLEPEVGDVDISMEKVLIAVGRGIQREDNLELAEELAEALGGVVCSTRPVADQGWLPTSRVVGKSGKTVKPKFYLAMGISGAPEHVESLIDSELIIAVNTDPAAPIFDVAKFGIEADIFDLFPVLTEQVRKAKGI